MTTMVCTRLRDGHVELKAHITLNNLDVQFLGHLKKMLEDIRPVPLAVGCERLGDSNTTDCIAVLHSHTSDMGVFEAINSFARIMSAVTPIDTIDVSGLTKR